MKNRNQCPVCLWSVRAVGGRIVEHQRDAYGQQQPCPGSQKPATAS